MVSVRRIYKARFADELKEGDVFSLYSVGAEAVTVIGPPVRIKNLVGHRSYLIIPVRKFGDNAEGQMVCAPTNRVFVRTVKGI
jgi:hypothetical protein